MSSESHPFAKQAVRGELPQLNTWRRSTLNYFALWTGLRGEDLAVDHDESFVIECHLTGQWWVFGPEGEWKDKLQYWLDDRHRKWQKESVS